MTRHDAAGPVFLHLPHPGREETAGTLSVPWNNTGQHQPPLHGTVWQVPRPRGLFYA